MISFFISLIFLIFYLLTCAGVGYLYVLVLGSLKKQEQPPKTDLAIHMAVAIPAHNEAQVIFQTIQSIRNAKYPDELLDIYVVADHCTDNTAEVARQAGSICFERNDGERGGKGEALAWLFQCIFKTGIKYGGMVVFDADTYVDPNFFKMMTPHLEAGTQVIQGNHIIRNPRTGWFPALTWAMFLIDNRCQNLGRSNLGFSAKNMGDSICFNSNILQWMGWGVGLAEDYAFRQQLLFKGIRIRYEPKAIGYGDAAADWQEARAQRARWLRGAHESSSKYARELLVQGIKNRDMAMLDGALQAYLPSYSTIALLTGIFTILAWVMSGWLWDWLPLAWTLTFLLIMIYPLLALAFERAPLRAFLVILTGPVFILWRTWLVIDARYIHRDVKWVRTPRHISQ